MGRAILSICSPVQLHDCRPCKVVEAGIAALFIKQELGYSAEESVDQIRENAYITFFLGFAASFSKALFDPSMMVYFREPQPSQRVASLERGSQVFLSTSPAIILMMHELLSSMLP
jgi:hypothetical protein